ncbi:hypothetical protein CN692_08930 [Bacillus sp. AFS002410]|uniref:hypothetical protein n=1 Tax=Bacillus sp. AFS002410 TaxID=2033481 RepID=UPI000BF240EC|nr:hypothetical protein [Bacillus sp. AFS002410]PEJ58388.1 hypothetical protein CN692_08930 [Bacillus sp. AFS002410]
MFLIELPTKNGWLSTRIGELSMENSYQSTGISDLLTRKDHLSTRIGGLSTKYGYLPTGVRVYQREKTIYQQE